MSINSNRLSMKNRIDSYVLIEHCASVLKQFGHLDDALHYYTKSLQMELTTLGENTEEVAITYNNMGSVCQDQGKFTKALEYYNKSLEIKKNILGENSEGEIGRASCRERV